ncbi:MAG TPA: TraR/DksA C4-type zinc finger protein [Elusimicrobiota bacterium]|jgi:DnaK suppressor protein|nr:TraR/DksA C4-type zinc finger protein [Elusimicrobiota bacterium]
MPKKKTAAAVAARRPAGAESPVSKSELAAIRKTLVDKRDLILRSMRKNQDIGAIQEVGDEADQAGQSIEKDILFEVSDNERTTLDQIEGALRKMDKGTYGICESCQKPIAKPRIKALPFARYCIGCQNSAERATVS